MFSIPAIALKPVWWPGPTVLAAQAAQAGLRPSRQPSQSRLPMLPLGFGMNHRHRVEKERALADFFDRVRDRYETEVAPRVWAIDRFGDAGIFQGLHPYVAIFHYQDVPGLIDALRQISPESMTGRTMVKLMMPAGHYHVSLDDDDQLESRGDGAVYALNRYLNPHAFVTDDEGALVQAANEQGFSHFAQLNTKRRRVRLQRLRSTSELAHMVFETLLKGQLVYMGYKPEYGQHEFIVERRYQKPIAAWFRPHGEIAPLNVMRLRLRYYPANQDREYQAARVMLSTFCPISLNCAEADLTYGHKDRPTTPFKTGPPPMGYRL
ncbi:MAG: hypothetical protein KC476_02735 [Cyanobacteria bacterium HKST-UBA06]|nr:hypothetical protein [Cyanobacteria bacterium HKST-UBA06]